MAPKGFQGTIERGNQLGRTFDFPTANISVKKRDLSMDIEEGLYASYITLQDESALDSITAICYKQNGDLMVSETHAFNVTGDYHVGELEYGKYLKIRLLFKLRESKKLKREEIKKQIEIDTDLGQKYFDKMKRCVDCKYSATQDHGYSNWTVEGSEMDCILNLNPNLPVESYGGIDDAGVAENCLMYEPGEGWHFDVDGETERPDESYLKQIRREHEIRKILKEESKE